MCFLNSSLRGGATSISFLCFSKGSGNTLVFPYVFFNMFLVVIETDAAAGEGDTPLWVEVCSNGLLPVYSLELSVKLYVNRWEFFYEKWNVMDFLIVGTDVVFLFNRRHCCLIEDHSLCA